MTNAPQTRRAVEKTLNFRSQRWLLYIVVLAVKTFVLLLIIPLFAVPVVLLLLQFPTLPIFYLKGRRRLPDDEFSGDTAFAGQIRDACRCFGRHVYFRHHKSSHADVGKHLRMTTCRSARGIRGKSETLVIEASDFFLLVTPRSYWVQTTWIVTSGDVRDIEIQMSRVTQEVMDPRIDDEVIDARWLHATKRGERDMRYRDNIELFEIRRYTVEVALGDFRWMVMAYSQENAWSFASAIAAIAQSEPTIIYTDFDDEEDGDEESEEEDVVADEEGDLALRAWHEVLGVPANATVAQIKAAYRSRLKEYHPDRVSHLGEKLRTLANEEATAINAAYEEALGERR